MGPAERSVVVGGLGVGEGGIDGQSTDFRAECSMFDAVMMVTCQYTFVQSHRMYNTESGLWGIMMRLCRFIGYSKDPGGRC